MKRWVLLLLATSCVLLIISIIGKDVVDYNALARQKTTQAVNAPSPPPIVKISVCRPDSAPGTLQQGSCTAGTFDTHQLVLDAQGASVNQSKHLHVGPVPDEHSTVYAPGTLGTNQDYLFFLSTGSGGHGNIGVSVLSGDAGPNALGQWTLKFPQAAEGYGFYGKGIGYGPVFETSTKPGVCPATPDSTPTEQDETYDMHYASAGSIVKDPTAPAGSMLMIYEGTNACIGNAGGNISGNNDDYISLAIATSLDYGRRWPTYRGNSTFAYYPLPDVNPSEAPNKPMGAWGADVCEGNCVATATPPPDSYGRYAVITPSPSLDYYMKQGVALPSKFGEQEISGFVDDVSADSPPYLYANWGNVKMGRAQLNGGTARLSFGKWDGDHFDATGIGGPEASVLPSSGPFKHCLAAGQKQFGSSISYVEQTHQYLLTFVCVSDGDPQLGLNQTDPHPGGAWFYATSYNLSAPSQWSPQDEHGNLLPQEIEGSWSEFTVATEPNPSPGASPSPTESPCQVFKGFYPSFMSMDKSAGHLSLDGYVFYLWGCQQGGTPEGRKFSSRQFKITTTDTTPPVTAAAVTGSLGANGWYTGPTTVSFTATDDLSGVATTQYSLNGGPWTAGTNVSLTTSGNYNILYQSIDTDENVEAPQSITVNLDLKSPVTTVAVTGPTGLNGWYTGPTNVNFNATDDLSGVAKTEYSQDGGQTWTAGTSVSFTSSAVYKLLYRSTDMAGNVETPRSITVMLDSVRPAITANASPSIILNTVRIVAVTISGNITDDLAGVDPTTARFAVHDEYGRVQPSAPVNVSADGSYSFTLQLRTFVRATDNDGRLYTIRVSAADFAGNSRTSETFVTARSFKPPPCKPHCI